MNNDFMANFNNERDNLTDDYWLTNFHNGKKKLQVIEKDLK